MHIVHVALQGCLKAGPVDYGLTADTGGHIRYLLDLVDALDEHPGVTAQTIITRGFHEDELGPAYANPVERYSDTTRIVRLFGQHRGYLSKEELYLDVQPLVGAFLTHLAAAPALPALCHAHYADAGTLAYAAKARFGIPFVFTAHSLGKVKRLTMGEAKRSVGGLDGAADSALRRREAVEDQAIGAADLIIASSRDEAEFQFASYPSCQPERVRINPPGCSLEAFASCSAAAAAGALARRIGADLADPARPAVLAIARPVWRKNLTGLMRAFAAEPWLRQNANLIIVAGSSHDAAMLSCENRAVLAALKRGVAELGLTGLVSLPARHSAHEVPAIYAYAARSGGVFANPAVHEPFGLTLIEAAAAGLPVVATDRGGPRDILAACRHGLTVDPGDEAAIGAALRSILSDTARRGRYVEAGRANLATYTWRRHAELYVRDALGLMRPNRPAALSRRYSSLLLSDIDNTLIGCREGLARFTQWLGARDRVLFGIATGRSLHDAIAVLSAEGVAPPQVMVTSVGSEIYYPTDSDYGVVRDEAWSALIGQDWHPGAIADHLAADQRLALQPPIEQRAHKRSWFANLNAGEVDDIAAGLEEAGLPAKVIYSHEKYLDILPRRASKGQALCYLRAKFSIPYYATAAAGDSGNDRDMLTAAARGIVVANHGAELADLLSHSTIRLSRASHAGGIVELLDGWPPLDPGAELGPQHHAGPHYDGRDEHA